MILVKTRLKKMPERCSKCGYNGVKYIYECDMKYSGRNVRYCTITGSDVPYIYDKKKKNWVYTKCNNCPLMEI